MKRTKEKGSVFTIRFTSQETKDIQEFLKDKPETIAATVRKGLKLMIALNKNEIFLSTSPDCQNKIPSSIL